MSTTEQLINAEMDGREQLALRRSYLSFMDRWAPDEERSEFDADLMMLVHQIYREAAKPYVAMADRMLSTAAFSMQIKKDGM